MKECGGWRKGLCCCRLFGCCQLEDSHPFFDLGIDVCKGEIEMVGYELGWWSVCYEVTFACFQLLRGRTCTSSISLLHESVLTCCENVGFYREGEVKEDV